MHLSKLDLKSHQCSFAKPLLSSALYSALHTTLSSFLSSTLNFAKVYLSKSTQHAFIVLMFLFQGCLDEANIGGTPDGRCTLVGSPYTVEVVLTSVGELPPNLSATLNGTNELVEQCRLMEDNFETYSACSCFVPPIMISEDRKEAYLRFTLLPGSDNFNYYFPQESAPPAYELGDLHLLTRNACDSEANLYRNFENIEIEWEPVYANGEDCGVSSYNGKVEIMMGDDFY